MSAKQWCVHRSNTCYKTLNTLTMLFPPVAKTFNVILTITNDISKNLPSSGTKWLPIITYIHTPGIEIFIW